MVVIAGTLRDSGDQAIAKARLTIVLTGAIVDVADDPDSTLLPVPAQYVITNGALATAQRILDSGALAAAAPIDLLPTFQFGVQYQFTLERSVDTIVFYLQDGTVYSGPAWQWTAGGTPDSQWYTGQAPGATAVTGPPTAEQQKLTRITASTYTKIDDFFATIQASPIIQEYSLLRKSGLTSTLDDSLYLVLEQLTTNPLYADRLSGKFNVRGIYDPAAFYNKNDAVVSGSVISVYINASSTAGNAPPDDAGDPDTVYWVKLPNLTVSPTNQTFDAFLPKTGGTMTGDLLLPGWGATPDPATAVRIADGDLRYARLGTAGSGVSNTFFGNQVISSSGSLTVPDRPDADNTINAANTKFVQRAIALISYLAAPTSRVRRNAAQSLPVGSNTTIVWDNFPVAGNMGTSGDYTAPFTGIYLFVLMPISFQMQGNFSANERRMRLRVFLTVNNVDVGDFFYEDQAAVNTTSGGLNAPLQFRRGGWRVETLTAGQVARVVANPSAAGVASFTACDIPAGQANNVLSIWRVV